MVRVGVRVMYLDGGRDEAICQLGSHKTYTIMIILPIRVRVRVRVRVRAKVQG